MCRDILDKVLFAISVFLVTTRIKKNLSDL